MATAQKYRVNQPIRIPKNYFEKAFWQQEKLIVGIDEVGRGCLAGPLVTAAVILPIGNVSRLLKDSKLLEPHERLRAYSWITKRCLYQVGIVHHRLIDRHNIWQATLIAMKKALVNLLTQAPSQPGAIVVDAMPLKLEDTGISDIPVYYFTQGERRSSSIAAASIVAKIMRDALMEKYDMLIPGYHLAQHKGYATKVHSDCIKKERYSIIHRQSFLGAYDDENKRENEHGEQQTICGSY